MDEDEEINFSRSPFKAVSRDDRLFGLPCASIVVSSEYWKHGNWILSWRSVTYKLNKTGPRIDPCGTPKLVNFSSDALSST